MGRRPSIGGSLADILAYAVAVALFILFLGRFIGLPLFLAAIASPSMEPSIRIGDVVVIQRGATYSVGDIVMWCSSPAYCVVHRVTKIGPTYVVTKGDANPTEDLPITSSSIVGKVIAVIPREFMLSIAALIIGIVVWRARPLSLPKDPVSLMVYGLVAFVVLSVVTLVFFPAPSVLEVGEFETPSITLLSATYENGTAVLKYRPVHTELISLTSCNIGASRTLPTECSHFLIDGDTITIYLPPELLATLNERGLNRFWISLVCSLKGNGVLRGNYTIIFGASGLVVRTMNRSLLIRNPNPFPVPYNLTILYIRDGGLDRDERTGYIDGFGVIVVEAGKETRVWYRLRYVMMGDVVEVAGWVTRG